MKDELKNAIRRAFDGLNREDGTLFDCPFVENSPNARKLHEVCVNHRLANHLQDEVRSLLGWEMEMFVDIEFNKEGSNKKTVEFDGDIKLVRPDIIIHNRKTGSEKWNFLVVECKKEGTTRAAINKDRKRILALMENEKYNYAFGLQVIYGRKGINGTLFFKEDNGMSQEEVDYNTYGVYEECGEYVLRSEIE